MTSQKEAVEEEVVPSKNWIVEYFEQVQQDPQLVQVWIAIGVGVLVGLVLLFILTRRRLGVVSRRVVLLLGPSDAGKTSLFSELVHGRSADTYTSMVENSATKSFSTESGASKSVQLVDLPGNERLRVAGLQKYKSSTRGVLYVVDASNVAKTIADSTEYLFRVLSDPIFHRNAVPVMVVCNKSDLDMAKSARVIERELEKEINLLRDTHSRNILSSTDGSASVDHVFLGKEGKDFKFSDIPNKIDFCEVSATNPNDSEASPNLNNLKKWIYSIA